MTERLWERLKLTINKLNPTRVNSTNAEDWDLLGRQWELSGRPRRFDYGEVTWMQITNGEEGIVFIPAGNGNTFGSEYGRSSFERILK